jgi:hypothetical protein
LGVVSRRLLPAALLLAAAAAAPAGAQLSPGELSRFHQGLEGARNCRRCHEAGKGVTPSLCLTCHTALGQRLAAGKGLHARTEYRACERCHVEHQGRDFDLVFWGQAGRAAFDHAATGFTLQGRHARLGCESCHNPRRLRDPAAISRGGANQARTFLGLSSTCASCHADPHRGQFAPRGCADCHGQERWSPPAGFDHGRTAFPLTGGHQGVACARCHPAAPGGGMHTVFKGVAHQTCAACHRDPHQGRLGTQCASCHDTAGWTRIEPGRFDHARTRFPLTGRHQRVPCAGCHPSPPGGTPRFAGTAFQTCGACHRDPHQGRLGAGCAGCHETAGWERVARGRFDHDRTRFPLRGRHTAVACESCHRPEGTLTMAHARCADCHADPHAGALARRADGGRCESCHGVEGFSPARFSVEDHARTAMPLTGGHLAVPCDACHRQGKLRFASTSCTECHADPHRGRTARWGACESCHRTARWSELAFDHGRTAFPLAEGHARVACRACHPGQGGELAFSGRPRECTGCHRDPHEGQFARSGRTECQRCHEATSWARVRFDHDRDTSFPLEGAHRAVPCAGCHRRETPSGPTMRYSGLGKACADCHGAARTGPRGGRR